MARCSLGRTVRRHLVGFAVVALAAPLLSACEPAPPPATPPPSTTTPALTPAYLLTQTVNAVWPDPASPPRSATWQVGTPPPQYAAYTTWSCFLWFCTYSIVVSPDYVTSRYVIAHEGGHVICVSTWGDGSEACADNIAAAHGYPASL